MTSDQNSRHAAENAPSDRNPTEVEDEDLDAESAPPTRSPSLWEPTTVRPPVSQTRVGKPSQQRIKRAPLKTALYMVGVLMILFSATMLPPMGVAWWYDGYAVMLPFAEALGAALGLGLLCWAPLYRFKVELRNRDGFILVVAFWFLSSLRVPAVHARMVCGGCGRSGGGGGGGGGIFRGECWVGSGSRLAGQMLPRHMISGMHLSGPRAMGQKRRN